MTAHIWIVTTYPAWPSGPEEPTARIYTFHEEGKAIKAFNELCGEPNMSVSLQWVDGRARITGPVPYDIEEKGL